MNAPLLSVCLITYNHVKYIEQALEGVLQQKVNFPWELVIADDYSSDGTREILLAYKTKYPDVIKLILQQKNVGAAQNWSDLIATPKSKYLAYLEGDDYWTDDRKLQKQVDFLEANPNYTICFHKVQVLEGDSFVESSFTEERYNRIQHDPVTIEDLLEQGNFIHSPSVVFKNIIEVFPFEFALSPVGDYFLYILLAQHGNIKRLEDMMAVYRNGVGIFSGQDSLSMTKNILTYQALILSYLEDELHKKMLVKKYIELLNNYHNHVLALLKGPDLTTVARKSNRFTKFIKL